jgi:prepilin-type N-terminal cleavage/methylation domain-containing protein
MTRTRSRGYTLVELMLALAILSVVMAGISGVLLKQSQASAVQSAQRDLEESGRLALLELGNAARMAGYGIDPPAAFDFARYACTTPNTPSTCNGGGRDRSDAPDEMVAAWRDPLFARASSSPLTGTVGAGPYGVTLNAPLTDPLEANRIVELVCAGGDTVDYLALNAAAAAGDTLLSLRQLTAADGYFPSSAPANTCYTTAAVLLVDRVRYYVANDADGVPALFRDRGRAAPELLYRGIEDVQFTYDIVQPQPPSAFAADGGTPAAAPGCVDAVSGNATWSFGACAGAAGGPAYVAAADGGEPDWRNANYDTPDRYVGSPMNIGNVTITVVARATRRSADGTGDAVPAIANRAARPRDAFRRAVMSISERPTNLLSRGSFRPNPTNLGGG